MNTNNSYQNCGYQIQTPDYGNCPQSAQNPMNCGIPQLVTLDDCGKITKIPANDGKILVGRANTANPNGQAEWKLETLAANAVASAAITASKGVKRVVDDFQLDGTTILPGSIPAASLSGLAIEALKALNAGTAPTAGVYNVTVSATGNPTLTTPVAGSTITPANVTAGSNKVTLSGTPIGAALQAFSVDVNEANLDHANIGGVLPVTKGGTGLSSLGTAGQFPVVNAAGTALQWTTPSAGGTVTLSGDVTGPSTATVLSAIAGVPVSTTPATVGQVLGNVAGVIAPITLPTVPVASTPAQIIAGTDNISFITPATQKKEVISVANALALPAIGVQGVVYITEDNDKLQVWDATTSTYKTIGDVTPSNLSLGTVNTTTQEISNSNGSGVVLPSATPTTAGLLSAPDKVIIDSLANLGGELATMGDGNTPAIPAANNANWKLNTVYLFDVDSTLR